MPVFSSLYYTKFEKATDLNRRNVALLDRKLYHPLETILRKLDVVSYVRLTRTCKDLNQKIRTIRGLRYPFDMGIINLYHTQSTTIWRHGTRHWSTAIASKIHENNPDFRPFISKIHVKPILAKGMFEKLIPVLCKMGVGKVKEICIRDVEESAWDELKEFVANYQIPKVTFFSKIPHSQQLSSIFLTMRHLEHKGCWTDDYMMNTTQGILRSPPCSNPDCPVPGEVLFAIIERWLKEGFTVWNLFTSDMNFVNECKARYATVTPGQTTGIPEKRPLLCDWGEKDSCHRFSMLCQDGRVISIQCYSWTGKKNIWIKDIHKSFYPAVFKRILGLKKICCDDSLNN